MRFFFKFLIENVNFLLLTFPKSKSNEKSKINAQSHHFLVLTRYRAAPALGIKNREKKFVAQYCSLNALDNLLFSKIEFKEIYAQFIANKLKTWNFDQKINQLV